MLGPFIEIMMRKNCTPLLREAHFQVEMLKNWRSRTIFWIWDVEKLHTAVARSTFPSQNVKKLTGSDHFLKLGCGKNLHAALARSTFASQNVKKKWRSRTIFWSQDVENLHVAVARSTFACQNVQDTCVLEHFWRFPCRLILSFS